jgi:hypothetical protein
MSGALVLPAAKPGNGFAPRAAINTPAAGKGNRTRGAGATQQEEARDMEPLMLCRMISPDSR